MIAAINRILDREEQPNYMPNIINSSGIETAHTSPYASEVGVMNSTLSSSTCLFNENDHIINQIGN